MIHESDSGGDERNVSTRRIGRQLHRVTDPLSQVPVTLVHSALLYAFLL